MTLSWTHLWIRPKWCIENWSYFYKNDNFWTNEYKKLSIVSCYSILFWLIFLLKILSSNYGMSGKIKWSLSSPSTRKKVWQWQPCWIDYNKTNRDKSENSLSTRLRVTRPAVDNFTLRPKIQEVAHHIIDEFSAIVRL